MSGEARVGKLPLAALPERLGGTSEWALLDVREEGDFADGHLLAASSVPLSRLELLIADLVPRRGTPLVVCGGDGLTERAAARLAQLGYTDTSILPGEPADWRAAGLETYTGVYVPSKAFGEFVEARFATPHIDADVLKARLDAGDDVLVLDSRPLDEYRTRNIPGAIDVPGVELVYRIYDLVRSPSTLVVVNCGGRTRSIIGAQSLINAGVENRVVALKNGTMGWHLAGYPLEYGQTRRAEAPSARSVEWSRAAAERMARRFDVPQIDRTTLDAWSNDPARTLYLIDVRQPEEYEEGHLAGSRHVQGGQLVQETDRYIAVRNARIVLLDGDGVRATVAGSWLRQMGFGNVHVLRDGLAGMPLETGAWQPRVLGLQALAVSEVEATSLHAPDARRLAAVIDLSLSTNYRRGHIPGAWFAVRSQLRAALGAIGPAKEVVLTSENGVLARLAAAEAAQLCNVPLRVLAGGNEAWRAAGGELEATPERWAVPPRDVWLKPFDQLQGKVEDRLNAYLRWEVDLLEQVKRDGSVRFEFPPAHDGSASRNYRATVK